MSKTREALEAGRTMSGKYDALDAAIVEAIKDGKRKFGQLQTARIRSLAGCGDDIDTPRAVDRRLQALRKSGLIRYQRGSNHGWVIVEDAR